MGSCILLLSIRVLGCDEQPDTRMVERTQVSETAMDKLKDLSKLGEWLLTDLFWPAYKQALKDNNEGK